MTLLSDALRRLPTAGGVIRHGGDLAEAALATAAARIA
jgi:hypothetical protein